MQELFTTDHVSTTQDSLIVVAIAASPPVVSTTQTIPVDAVLFLSLKCSQRWIERICVI